MKERILKNWTVQRLLYTVIGVVVAGSGFMQHDLVSILFGAYFASMGVFAFGCAAGCCTYVPPRNRGSKGAIQLQEVKNTSHEQIQ